MHILKFQIWYMRIAGIFHNHWTLTYLTSSMTYSLGAFLTSSPLICTTWSPGSSLSSLGPPASQTKISSKKPPMVQMIILSWYLWSKWNGSNLTSTYTLLRLDSILCDLTSDGSTFKHSVKNQLHIQKQDATGICALSFQVTIHVIPI